MRETFHGSRPVFLAEAFQPFGMTVVTYELDAVGNGALHTLKENEAAEEKDHDHGSGDKHASAREAGHDR